MVPLPEETDSYQPVSHYDLTDRLLTVSRDILTDYCLVGEKYALARQGQQMFAFLQFRKEAADLGLCIAIRNNYDRSMSVGMAIGATVFICVNLALTGEIAVMKKHTKNVWTTLEDLAISTIYRSQRNFQTIQVASERMRGIPFSDSDAFSTMGILFGMDIVSPRQIPIVKEEWLRARHEVFRERNAWSFYNACTEALKSCPPNAIMEKHIRLHREMGKRLQLGQ
ncbi:MAG: hypothetical protein A4E69_02786 [Syntrophus sp. PtaB.Bin138]|nr:MAG: hypothetical protein A4E69_02786 [Syntrophus sp. PtaB.Bin138]